MNHHLINQTEKFLISKTLGILRDISSRGGDLGQLDSHIDAISNLLSINVDTEVEAFIHLMKVITYL